MLKHLYFSMATELLATATLICSWSMHKHNPRIPVKFGEDVFEAAYPSDIDFTFQNLLSFLMTLVNGEQWAGLAESH